MTTAFIAGVTILFEIGLVFLAVGRRTHYTVDARKHLRHPATAHHRVGELLAVLADDDGG